jgi:hypothetical protein
MSSGAALRSEVTYQTARLGPGRHTGPGPVVCAMELASMLAGERFSDHPRSVCPIIAALIRTYNDVIGKSRRRDLYRYASDCVGSRGGPTMASDYALQRRRAARALDWARARSFAHRRLASNEAEVDMFDAPNVIAWYVVGSIDSRQAGGHIGMLSLLDELLAMRPMRARRALSSSGAIAVDCVAV